MVEWDSLDLDPCRAIILCRQVSICSATFIALLLKSRFAYNPPGFRNRETYFTALLFATSSLLTFLSFINCPVSFICFI